MQLPYIDITEIGILLVVGELILLITAQISPLFYGLTDFALDKKKLDNAAVAAGVLFLVTLVIKILSIIKII